MISNEVVIKNLCETLESEYIPRIEAIDATVDSITTQIDQLAYDNITMLYSFIKTSVFASLQELIGAISIEASNNKDTLSRLTLIKNKILKEVKAATTQKIYTVSCLDNALDKNLLVTLTHNKILLLDNDNCDYDTVGTLYQSEYRYNFLDFTYNQLEIALEKKMKAIGVK